MRLFGHQMVEFFDRWDRFGGTLAMFTRLLGDDKLTEWWIGTLNEKLNANPFEQTVDEQIAALRVQNEAGNWGIGEDVFARLAATAPAWPKGKDAFRSIRIRWGEGAEGVYFTFERHWEAMCRVHPKHWRWELLHSKPMPFNGKDVERLRLLNGNDTHHAVVEWVVVGDLSANRKRKDITSVRGSQSLADEGLVLAWMFPKRADAIDYSESCAWYCAGYEANVPGSGDEEWHDVVVVSRNVGTGEVSVSANWRSYDDSGYSVPPIG